MLLVAREPGVAGVRAQSISHACQHVGDRRSVRRYEGCEERGGSAKTCPLVVCEDINRAVSARNDVLRAANGPREFCALRFSHSAQAPWLHPYVEDSEIDRLTDTDLGDREGSLVRDVRTDRDPDFRAIERLSPCILDPKAADDRHSGLLHREVERRSTLNFNANLPRHASPPAV